MNGTPLHENPVYLAGEFSHRFRLRVSAAFKAAGIDVTWEQFSILALLFYGDGINQQDIAAAFSRDKTTVARIIHRMIRDGLVERLPDEKDQRNKRVFLTGKGRQLQQQLVVLSGEFYLQVMKDIPREGVLACCRILNSMLDNLEKQ